jgi:hypothetical protein
LNSKVLSSGEMLNRLIPDDPDERMPPIDSHRELSPADRKKLVAWIKHGAAWPEDDRHWAYVPPVRPRLPLVDDADWPRNEIDHFVLARLEHEKLRPMEATDKATLLRRVTFDLTGLPPTIDDLDAFLTDESANACENVVDRLLASERYGEHTA